uniref:Uncharacterized protein n=1 Tax=Cacopsylla melanoneura TaxID=428564 RepID=A0A8D8PQS3_9HEMI
MSYCWTLLPCHWVLRHWVECSHDSSQEIQLSLPRNHRYSQRPLTDKPKSRSRSTREREKWPLITRCWDSLLWWEFPLHLVVYHRLRSRSTSTLTASFTSRPVTRALARSSRLSSSHPVVSARTRLRTW